MIHLTTTYYIVHLIKLYSLTASQFKRQYRHSQSRYNEKTDEIGEAKLPIFIQVI